ncbi:hypothetical protein KL921_005127 [Ogataea angusta]|nr:hypothetical protein KL921_005127 [Ogataea angusta]
MSGTSSYTLNSGATIPKVGLGVYDIPIETTELVVYEALKAGYRHVDSAATYDNEEQAANGIARWLAENPTHQRSEIFYTTKVFDDHHGYELTRQSVEESLEKAAKIGYIDLVLVHSPRSDYNMRHGTWNALQEFAASGKVKNIGVSNYGIKHLRELLAYPDLKIKPAVNQIELHPWLLRPRLVNYCKRNNIVVEAYSPLAKGYKFDDPDLLAVARRHRKTPSQILIAWSLQKGYVVLPKTEKVARLKPNLEVFDIRLSADDLKRLEKPGEHFNTGWDPTVYPLDNEK